MGVVIAFSIIGGIFGIIWIFLDNSDFSVGKFIRNLIFLLISAGCGLAIGLASRGLGTFSSINLKWWNILIVIALIIIFSLVGNDAHTEEVIDEDGVQKVVKCGLGSISYAGILLYTLFIAVSF